MFSLLLLLFGWLSRADGYATIELSGIGRDDRAVVVLGNTYTEIGFSRSRRTCYDYQMLSIHHRNCRLRQSR